MSFEARTRRRRRDLRTLLLCVGLFGLAGGSWWLWSSGAREERERTLAGLPPFPSQGVAHERPVRHEAAGPAAAPTAAPPSRDRLAAFALAPARNLAVVQVNALVNTPLYAKLKACLPAELSGLADAGAALGFELERDVDRVAMIPGGVAVSGRFDGSLAQRLAQAGGAASRASYRDAEVFTTDGGACVAQLPGLLILGPSGGCEALVDRTHEPAAPGAGDEVLQSDLYTRSDLSALREGLEGDPGASAGPIAPILAGLGGLTLRANVWDDVALSLDGTARPEAKGRLEDLASMARFSVEAGKLSSTDDPAWSALLDKAKIDVRGGHLQIDLAVPAAALFDRLALPCSARDGGS